MRNERVSKHSSIALATPLWWQASSPWTSPVCGAVHHGCAGLRAYPPRIALQAKEASLAIMVIDARSTPVLLGIAFTSGKRAEYPE